MIKSIVVIVVSALLVGVTLAEEKNETQECAEEIARIIENVDYPEGFEGLVEVTREFYPKFENLLQAFGNWSNEYREAIRMADPEVFSYCEYIYSRAVKTPESKCDLVEFLERGSNALMEIVRLKPDTAKYFEAYYMCMVQEETEIKECLKESADSISRMPYTEDVEKLVEVSRQIYPNLEDLIKMLYKDPTSEFKEAIMQATGNDLSRCDEVIKYVMELGNGCFIDLVEQLQPVSRIIRFGGPQTENILIAIFACQGARMAQ